jgi:hypothetical protein
LSAYGFIHIIFWETDSRMKRPWSLSRFSSTSKIRPKDLRLTSNSKTRRGQSRISGRESERESDLFDVE